MSPKENWYSHLVAQSRNNNIYPLIHQFLEPDWEPNHDFDFVVVRRSQLPEHLKNIPLQDLSKKLLPQQYCFPGNDYVLLHNYKLTEYLHFAKWAKFIEDFEDRSFIELRYDWTEEAQECWNDPPAYSLVKKIIREKQEPTPVQKKFPESEEEQALLKAYDLLRDGVEKGKALEYAEAGRRFLDNQNIDSANSEEVLQMIERKMLGYNIVAMIYAWNNHINKASEVDSLYISNSLLWSKLSSYIEPYLEMLMIKKQEDYLHHLFSDKKFRRFFLGHYEAFVSLFVNPDYELTKMGEVVNIINRVNNDKTYK